MILHKYNPYDGSTQEDIEEVGRNYLHDFPTVPRRVFHSCSRPGKAVEFCSKETIVKKPMKKELQKSKISKK